VRLVNFRIFSRACLSDFFVFFSFCVSEWFGDARISVRSFAIRSESFFHCHLFSDDDYLINDTRLNVYVCISRLFFSSANVIFLDWDREMIYDNEYEWECFWGTTGSAATCRSFLLTCIFRETDGNCITFNATRRLTFEVIVLLSRQMCRNMNNYSSKINCYCCIYFYNCYFHFQ